MGWLGSIWQGWTRMLALITLLVFMSFSGEQTMTIYWYQYNLQPYIILILVNTAPKILELAQKCWLVGYAMARLDKKPVLDCPPRINVSFLMDYNESLLVSV